MGMFEARQDLCLLLKLRYIFWCDLSMQDFDRDGCLQERMFPQIDVCETALSK